MKPRTAEAERLEADYLARIRAVLGANGDEICRSVREHIEEAVAEFPAPEVTLVQMAQVIERMGPPEAYRETAAPPAGPRAGASDAALRLLDKLWLASLVTTIGLYVPIIDFYFFQLIGCIMMVHALRGELPPELKSVRRLAVTTAILTVVACPVAILALYQPLTGLLQLPVGIGLLVVSLMQYWNLIGGIASLLRTAQADAVASSLLESRRTYVAIHIILFAFSLIAGVVIVVVNPNPQAQDLAVAGVGLALLPLGWILGTHFILKPISRAHRTLAGSAMVWNEAAAQRS